MMSLQSLRSRSLMMILCGLALTASAWAQPKLRLVTTALGPLTFAQGAIPAAQSIEAYNAGTGALNLTLSSNVPWMTAAVGAARNCSSRTGTCLPLNIAFSTSTLARGIYTGTLTVRDPNAIDAPQTITVSVQPGGGVPDRADLYVPANGGSVEVPFVTTSQLTSRVSTSSGGDWLALALDGQGSFRFRWDYKIVARHLPGLPEGAYNGSLALTGSTFPADNKTVPVVMNVTTRPIAGAAPVVNARVVQGNLKTTQFAAISNLGMSALAISGATVATATGGNWLTATTDATPLVKMEIDPASLAVGTYTATVTVNSNAVNSPTRIPVTLDIIASGPPQISIGGVLNNATFARDEALAPGGITSVFGEQFTAPGADLALSSGAPLPTTLGGARVLVNGVPAPLYFVSYGQINFQMPFNLTPGEAVIRVERAGAQGNGASVAVVQRAPRVLIWPIAGNYGIVVNGDGTLPLPAGTTLGSFQGRPARAGDALVIYAIGLGQTDPPVTTGAASPADPLGRVAGTKVIFGARGPFGAGLDPIYAGLSPGFVGLYQVNVVVPSGLATGAVDVTLDVDGTNSNTFKIQMQ